MSINQQNARHQSVILISRFLQDLIFPDRELDHVKQHRTQSMQMVYGVLRNLSVLKWLISEMCDRPPRVRIEACLLCGLYELLYMHNIEEFATVHEFVNVAKQIASYPDSRLVNAVLRRFLREKDSFITEINALPFAIRSSHPDVLFTRWCSSFGNEKAERLCLWDNTPAFTTIRPCLNRVSVSDYMAQLEKADINATLHPFYAEFISLPHGCRVVDLPGYHDGLFTIQDPATMVSIDLLNPQADMTVLDACAAPGGKSMLIAERMKNRGRLLAFDIYEDRLERLRENATRMNYSNIIIGQGDATQIENIPVIKQVAPDGLDAILIDVPCSNTGVIRRRPDVRWRFSKTHLKKLLKTQVTILYSASKNVKVDGIVVYSTCSLEPEEDQLQISRWLQNNSAFSLEKEVLLFPPDTETDGAYAARIRRTK